MTKLTKKVIAERRRYLRLLTPISITYTVPASGKVYVSTAKNVSADGLRFETHDRLLKLSDVVDLKLDISGVNNPVHCKGTVIWKKKLSLEDGTPFDVGMEFSEIEDDNKNTFLKFLCDSIYNMPKEAKMPKDRRSTLSAVFLAVTIAMAVAGCAGIEVPQPQDVLKEPLGQGSLRVGMSKNEVISLWGKPDEVRMVEDKDRWKGTREMWVYHAQMAGVPVDADYLSKTKRLYFDGDNLTTIGDKS